MSDTDWQKRVRDWLHEQMELAGPDGFNLPAAAREADARFALEEDVRRGVFEHALRPMAYDIGGAIMRATRRPYRIEETDPATTAPTRPPRKALWDAWWEYVGDRYKPLLSMTGHECLRAAEQRSKRVRTEVQRIRFLRLLGAAGSQVIGERFTSEEITALAEQSKEESGGYLLGPEVEPVSDLSGQPDLSGQDHGTDAQRPQDDPGVDTQVNGHRKSRGNRTADGADLARPRRGRAA